MRENNKKTIPFSDQVTEPHNILSGYFLLDKTLSSLRDGVITINDKCRILYANPKAQKILAWDHHDLIGSNIDAVLELVGAEDQAWRKSPVRSCLQSKKTEYLLNVDLISSDGGLTPVSLKASPMLLDEKGTTGVVLLISNTTETRKLELKLQNQANRNALTGLWNRRAFEKSLGELQADSKITHSQHALLYIDLDQFKIVNDTAGHHAGDELLKQVCSELEEVVRASDMLARLGGDEFGVLLPRCSLNDALGVSEKIRAKVEDFVFVWNNQHYKVGSSIGVAVIDEMHVDLNILSLADMACYSAKEAGRNRVHLYTADDKELAERQDEMSMISRVRSALDENRMLVYTQAIVPLGSSSGEAKFNELLVRMLDEEGQLVPPGAFIPAAERFGLMPEIDKFVIETAIEWLEYSGDTTTRLSINLSGSTLSSEDMMDYIEGRFHQYRKVTERICLEITETAAITNFKESIRFFNRLKKMGFTIALDDFGSGLSSFRYLKDMPVDIIKIDGIFVRNMINEPIDRAMVEAIAGLSNEMGIICVAEFIENIETQHLLEILGIELGQGFFLDKPKPLYE